MYECYVSNGVVGVLITFVFLNILVTVLT